MKGCIFKLQFEIIVSRQNCDKTTVCIFVFKHFSFNFSFHWCSAIFHSTFVISIELYKQEWETKQQNKIKQQKNKQKKTNWTPPIPQNPLTELLFQKLLLVDRRHKSSTAKFGISESPAPSSGEFSLLTSQVRYRRQHQVTGSRSTDGFSLRRPSLHGSSTTSNYRPDGDEQPPSWRPLDLPVLHLL